MSYTVEILVTPGSGNVIASPRTGATGTAAFAGYAITQIDGDLHEITINEELVGPWKLTAGDGLSYRLLDFVDGTDAYPLSALLNVPSVDQIVTGIRDDSAPYSPSNINLTRKIGSTQPIYIAWPTSGSTITATKSFNNGPAAPTAGDVVEMSPQPDWDIPDGEFWYELEWNSSDRPLIPSIVEFIFTDGSETQTVAVTIVT